MLGQILDIDLPVVAKAAVYGDESLAHSLDLKTLHKFTREVQSGSGGDYRPLVACIYRLVTLPLDAAQEAVESTLDKYTIAGVVEIIRKGMKER